MKRVGRVIFVIIIILVSVYFGVKEYKDIKDKDKVLKEKVNSLTYDEKYKKLKYNNELLDKDFVTNYNDYTVKLSKNILNLKRENIAFSPLSIHYALSILNNGTAKNSRDELLKFLSQEDVDNVNKNNFRLLSASAKYNDKGIFDINNSLWISRKKIKNINQDFIDKADKYYLAPVNLVDFGKSETSDKMSKWVSDMTRGMINPDFDISEEELMMIINTLYFESDWKLQFDKKKTKEDNFIKADNSTVKREFMHAVEAGEFYKGSKFTKAGKYFKNGIKLDFVLPDKDEDLYKLLLDEKVLKEMIESIPVESAEITWSIPKFKVSDEYDFIPILKELGVKDLFNYGKANFSYLTESLSVNVNSINHIAVIEIHEKGGKAAAVTSVKNEAVSIPTYIDINLNKPFLYILSSEEKIDGGYKSIPIMIGTVGDPEY